MQTYGANSFPNMYVLGCYFDGHASGYSILNNSGNQIGWNSCSCADSTAFIQGVSGGAFSNQDVQQDKALDQGVQYATPGQGLGRAVTALSGSITIKSSQGGHD